MLMYVTSIRDLELRHLTALDAVAAEGTFGRAAERLGYTQSAVSQQVAALERVLGAPVFDRPGGPRPVELTPLGHLVLAHARDLLARVEVVVDDIERFRSGTAGRLAVGTFQSVSTALLPAIVGRMRTQLPDIEIRLFESEFDEELDAQLSSGALDVSFRVGTDLDAFEVRHLVDDPFVLLAPHGEFPVGPVHIADIGERPLIGQQDNPCQRLNEAGLRAGGIEPRYVFRTNENGAVAAMVRAGMGLAVLPRLCIEPDDRRLAVHEIIPPIPDRVVSLAWRRGRTLSPAAEHFIAVTEDVCRRLEPV